MTVNLIEYAPVHSLAQYYQVRERYVYVLASRHRWRKVRVGRQVRYHVWDAEQHLRPGLARRKDRGT